LGWCDQIAYRLGNHVPRRDIGLFERDVDLPARLKKQRRIGQRIPHSERIDVCSELIAGIVRSNWQRFLRRPWTQRLADTPFDDEISIFFAIFATFAVRYPGFAVRSPG
jgi:hypothetical protein